ncbi:MAG TPA: hypothetical protein VD997_12730 [Phycisphaerales bacterium]|nr:hypothetical protein [Phycisphaerales bacterium]
MRRISAAALLGLTVLAGGLIGCESNDNDYYDDGYYRGDRIGSRDWDHDRDWDRDRRRDWDRDGRRDWDRDGKRDWNRDGKRDWDKDWDHDRDHLRRDHDHRGEGIFDRDFDRREWDRR